MSVYARFPLNQSQKQIRLVTIQPSMYLSSPIQCNLSAVSLTNPPHYEALSYRWGDEKIRSTIQLENEEFSITTSLKEALVRLRDQTRPMKYWIDQICINQGDASEQNGQVPLMGEVYSKAGIVKAWLGEEAEESEKAFRLSEPVLFVRMAGPIVVDVSNLQAFVQLILREYWRRVWMIQEIGRARQ
ncbi:heterokaryon incompatibility protein-domain-containing protein, partial [Hyaloscypha sp. PMI_1271]